MSNFIPLGLCVWSWSHEFQYTLLEKIEKPSEFLMHLSSLFHSAAVIEKYENTELSNFDTLEVILILEWILGSLV